VNRLFNKILLRDTGWGPDRLPSNRQVDVVCVVFELLNFNTILSRLDLKELAEVMNDFYSKTSTIIMHSAGSVNEFSQQFVTCFYGMFEPQVVSEHQVITAARAVIDSVEEHRFHPEVGAGICCDKILYGSFGSEHRLTFTGFGPAVSCAHNLSAKGPGVNVCEQFQRKSFPPFASSDLIKTVKHTPFCRPQIK
jgi:class 3 adenylate cyclase